VIGDTGGGEFAGDYGGGYASGLGAIFSGITSGNQGATPGTVPKSSNWWSSNTWGGGSGRMAARGNAIAALKAAARARWTAQQALNLQNAHIFSHVAPGIRHATVQTTIPTGPKGTQGNKYVQLGQALAQVTSEILTGRHIKRAEKKRQKTIAHLQHKMRQIALHSAPPQYQEIALSGLNSGPPITGSTYY
jgi:hypothetical protein